MKTHNLSYEFYFNVFCGGAGAVVPAQEFGRYAALAVKELEALAMSELPHELSDEVSECLCEVAEMLFRAGANGNLKSESIDGYSVTFADKSDVDREIKKIIIQRLGKSGVLYAGVE